MLPLLLLLLAMGSSRAQRPPPNYSPDALPDTSFSCSGRAAGGYYADVEAGCQMFHVCGASQGPSFRFLCPNDTVFDQQNLICANWFQVVCEHDSVFHARNFEIFKTHSNKEASFNTLYEDDLPDLDDYDYETGFSAGPAFGSSPRRAAATSSPPRQFDQFVAASTARPVVVTLPSRGRWRGSTVSARGTTEPPRFPPRQNSLDRDTGKRPIFSDQSAQSGERPSFSVSDSVERTSKAFDSPINQSPQEQGRSAEKSVPSSGNTAQDSDSTGSQSSRRTFGRVPPTSAPAESQTVERTSRRFNSISPAAGSRQGDNRLTDSRSVQKTSGRTTLTASISVVDSFDPTGPAASVVPTAAALTSEVRTTTQPQRSSAGGQATPPTLSRASASFAQRQTQTNARTQSQSTERAQFQSNTREPPQFAKTGLSDTSTNELSATGAAQQAPINAGRLASISTPVRPARVTFSAPNNIPPSPARVTFSAPPSTPPRPAQVTFSAPNNIPPRPARVTFSAPPSTPPSPARVTFSAPPESESPVTTTEPAAPLSPVAARFFGPNVLPEVTARTVQSLSDRTAAAARKGAAAAAGGQPRTQQLGDDDALVTTFHPRPSTTPSSPTTTAGAASGADSTASSTDSEIEIITESTIRAGPQQGAGVAAPTGRRRTSAGRRTGSARRGSDSSGLSRPRATVATPGRVRASPPARPPVPRTSATVVTGRPRSAAGRRGRGGRRFNPAGAAVKPASRRRQVVPRVTSTAAQEEQQNSVGVDQPEAKLGGKKDDGARRGATAASVQRGFVAAQKAPVNIGRGQAKQEVFTSRRRPSVVRSTTETASVDVDLTTADSISRPSAVPSQVTQTTQESKESPLIADASPQSVTTTEAAATTTEAAATTPIIIRRRIRVRGRPSRRPIRRQATTIAPPPSPSPSPSPLPSPLPSPSPALLLLPTNKEAAPGGSRLLRRPKLQLSSALAGVGRSRRLQQNTAAREARSGATRLVAPSRRRGAIYGRSPTTAREPPAPVSERRRAASLLSDYDYEYYDDESDALFRKLAEANELVLNDLARVRRQN